MSKITKEHVQEMIKALDEGSVVLGTKKEINELPNILSSDERILCLSSGLMEGNTWLIVVTNFRVLFLDKGFFFGLKTTEVPLQKIVSVESDKGLIAGSVTIGDGSTKHEIRNMLKKSIQPLVDSIEFARRGLASGETIASRAGHQPTTADHRSSLATLKELLESGDITDEEYSSRRSELINSI